MSRCPRCKVAMMRDPLYTNALSRRDNKTYICSQCGEEEAFIDAKLISRTPTDYNFCTIYLGLPN